MRYVTLKGGPCDGRIENIVDHCETIQVRPPHCGLAPTPQAKLGSPCHMIEGTLHTYRQSEEDPAIFIHERQGNEPEGS